MKKNKFGFSLIEVLVFISILSFVFISGVALGIVSVRNSINSENKILAAHYGEELLAWLRSQKDADWLDFVGKTSTTPFCFYKEPVSEWPTTAVSCNSTQLVRGLFRRQARLIYDSSLQGVKVDVTIDWNEGNNSYSVPIEGVFTQLE